MNDLTTTMNELVPTQYQGMLTEISNYYPVIAKATKNFNKTQSQFMDNMLTLSQPTELRSLRQILAEVNKSKMALDEAFFGIRKKQIVIKQKRRSLESEKDDLARELLELEIAEVENQIYHSMGYVEGAIRKIAAYMNQYRNITSAMGMDELTEADFEADEERYHIMKAFEQALCAARSHGGVIDEGNHIYLYQIGINGTAAQSEVAAYMASEGKLLKEGQKPDHSSTWEWLHAMADKYKGCAKEFAAAKHMALTDKTALHLGE
jgi:hypothetical protein